jgi:hypothetical protein
MRLSKAMRRCAVRRMTSSVICCSCCLAYSSDRWLLGGEMNLNDTRPSL